MGLGRTANYTPKGPCDLIRDTKGPCDPIRDTIPFQNPSTTSSNLGCLVAVPTGLKTWQTNHDGEATQALSVNLECQISSEVPGLRTRVWG